MSVHHKGGGMFGYYIGLALRSLQRNLGITMLVISALSLGLGTFTTVFGMLWALSSDPIADKSSQLFAPIVDNWGPTARIPDPLRTQLSYADARALLQARRAARQSAIYSVYFALTPTSSAAKPFG